jgi:hypothetical protein
MYIISFSSWKACVLTMAMMLKVQEMICQPIIITVHHITVEMKKKKKKKMIGEARKANPLRDLNLHLEK